MLVHVPIALALRLDLLELVLADPWRIDSHDLLLHDDALSLES
jgi:hypothetical protein